MYLNSVQLISFIGRDPERRQRQPGGTAAQPPMSSSPSRHAAVVEKRGRRVPTLDPVARIDRAETFFAACKATIRHGDSRAYYAQEVDYAQMPPFESFECFHHAESYYSALADEMTHWTKHPVRLARDLGRKQWGDEGYAQEELVAELGAAFLCADLELATEPREENASYIANWLEVLKNDNRFIFKAAARAQRAADYLRAFSGGDDGSAAASATITADDDDIAAPRAA